MLFVFFYPHFLKYTVEFSRDCRTRDNVIALLANGMCACNKLFSVYPATQQKTQPGF